MRFCITFASIKNRQLLDMIERFYCIKHLSTQQLRELYTTYRTRGWVDSEYYKLTPASPPKLSEAEIILNIDAEDKNNYFVFMLDHEDEEDGIMFCFGMAYQSDFAVFLHLPPELLDEIVEKYALPVCSEDNCYSEQEYIADNRLMFSLN
jgi:hypothetical protein